METKYTALLLQWLVVLLKARTHWLSHWFVLKRLYGVTCAGFVHSFMDLANVPYTKSCKKNILINNSSIFNY